MSLGAVLETFLNQVEELDLGDTAHAARLDHLVKKLARDGAELIADYAIGEIPALIQRSHEVLVALAAEADDPEDRQRRYSRQAALLNLLTLADTIQSHHAGNRAQQRKTVEALRDLVADALRPLIPED